MKSDYTKVSQRRTGTPPYMVHELLRETRSLHLYRHDLESLFYTMLLMTVCHTIETPKGEDRPRVVMRESRRLLYQDWPEEPRYDVFGLRKEALFSRNQPIELSLLFKDFLPWLRGLQNCFSTGFKHKPSCVDDDGALPELAVALTESGVHPAQSDDETLGEYIRCATVTTPARYPTGARRAHHP